MVNHATSHLPPVPRVRIYETYEHRSVGSVTRALRSFVMNGLSSNAGFTKSFILNTSSGTSRSLTSVDGSWSWTLNSASLSKGTCAALVVTQGAANASTPDTQILSEEIINCDVAMTVWTFAESQFTVLWHPTRPRNLSSIVYEVKTTQSSPGYTRPLRCSALLQVHSPECLWCRMLTEIAHRGCASGQTLLRRLAAE